MDVFRLIVDQSASSRLLKPVIGLIGLGEPLLNPRVYSMVKYAKKRGLPVDVVSNFTVADSELLAKLVEAQLDWLSVSIDTASPETFEKIRVGARFDEVVKNVRLLLEIRKDMNSVKPQVFFSTTLDGEDFEEIPAIVGLAKSLAIEGVHFRSQIAPGKKEHEHPPVTTLHFRDSHGNVEIKVREKQPICLALWKCYITFEGKVLPCPFLMEMIPREEYPRFEFGDVTEKALLNIWFSRRYMRFRMEKAFGLHPDFCDSCPSVPNRN